LRAIADFLFACKVKARELRGKKREELETQLETLKQVGVLRFALVIFESIF
jgi:hypothetical protein